MMLPSRALMDPPGAPSSWQGMQQAQQVNSNVASLAPTMASQQAAGMNDAIRAQASEVGTAQNMADQLLFSYKNDVQRGAELASGTLLPGRQQLMELGITTPEQMLACCGMI